MTLRLSRGEDVSGRITELDDEHVCLDLGGKTITVFDELLAGLEVHQEDGIESDVPSEWPLELEQSSNESRPRSDHDRVSYDPPLGTQNSYESSKVSVAITKIDSIYSEALKRVRIDPPEPDFAFPEAEFPAESVDSARVEWGRARDMYNYALKVKELNRINNIISQVLGPLARRYPDSAAARSVLGRLLLKLDRHSEAKEHLRSAAALSDKPEYWMALASAAAEDTGLECYALRRHFYLMPPWTAPDPWYRYIALAISHRDLHAATQIIRDCSQRHKLTPSNSKLLSESLIYLLLSAGAESLARRVAVNFLRGGGSLYEGWMDEFNHPSPSDEVLTVERGFSHPDSSVSRQSDRTNSDHMSRGRITSFGNQRFGFIDGDQQYYFRIDDVSDEGLQQILIDGNWRTGGDVEFEVLPAGHHRYPRATRVVRLQDSFAWLLKAQDLLQASQYPQAMEIARRVLRSEPTNEDASQLEERIKQQMQRDGFGLPKGSGPYASAKRAQLIDHDFGRAESLYNQAIRDGNNAESAIKDLASLLQQQGKDEEAIALLERHSRSNKGFGSYDNMLATQYQHSDRHDDAIKILERLTRVTPWPKKGILLRRIAFSYFKSERYNEAEQTLRDILEHNSADLTAQRWLAGLEDARKARSYDDADAIIGSIGGLNEAGIELSILARSAIDRCTYEGVDAARLQAGEADAKDVARVEDYAKQLGTKRPRDRAAYYLSAAALLERTHGDYARIYDYLRRYFTSMADATSIEMGAADVVRSYYVESLALVFDSSLDEAWRSLVRYLATFSSKRLNEVEVMPRRSDRSRQMYIQGLRKTLAMSKPVDEEAWLEGLLVLGSQSNFARDAIGAAIQKDAGWTGAFATVLDSTTPDAATVQKTWDSRCRDHADASRRRLALCQALTRYPATVASMEDLVAQLHKASGETTSQVDRTRMNGLSDIASFALAFCRASDFEDKERNYWMVINQAERFSQEVINAPTRYSHDGLLPVVDHLKSLIEEEYAQTLQTSGVDLGLQLLVEQYHRTNKGVRLQIEIENERGCSPASSVRIRLGPEDSEYFATDRWEQEAAPTLRGGDSVVTQMVVHPKPAALKDGAFAIEGTATYRSLLGEDKCTESQAWTVRLYRDADFDYIRPNPYTPFAGVPVDDPNMFVGRDALLSQLEDSLLAGPGSRSIVLFGQKRAGKSSLLEHLRQRLLVRNEEVVPVCFSLQEISPELTIPTLLYRIQQGVAEAFEDLRLDGVNVPDFSPPAIDTVGFDANRATSLFHKDMTSLRRECEGFGLKIILLIDEFTDIFKEIRSGRIPRRFMKGWKAIIERKYFASVLVGQDVMPAFKEEFPNEFGVTEDIRVTYLHAEAATTLIHQPIGADRFVGRAVTRLLDLTACSPYYTMMFCARLVDYMNDTKSAKVTEADIATVKDQMLRGDGRLTIDKFDNLLCAGDGVADSGIDPDDTLAVCVALARGSNRGWCSREQISGVKGVSDVDSLLSDLERRDVVERNKEKAYRLRVGLFRDWLLQQGD